MYIEFALPTRDQHMRSVAIALNIIETELKAWSEKYGIPYTSKTVKLFHRVCFESDNLYTFFTVTWNPRSYTARRWRFVVDLNNKTNFGSSV
jgi:hypothetical protein